MTSAHVWPRLNRGAQLVAATLLVATAGCGDGDATPGEESTKPSITEAPSDTDPDETPHDDDRAPSIPTTTEPPRADGPPTDLDVVTIGRIELSATGIGEGVGSFGQEGSAVLHEIAAEMDAAGVGGIEGSPSHDSGYYVDGNGTSSCHGMEVRKVTWEDFSVILRRGADGAGETLVGWVLGDNDGVPTGLTTPEGIGIGTPSASVEAIYGPGAFGTAGDERSFFTSGDLPAIRGVTDAPHPDGAVTTLAAGTDCLTIPS